MGSALRVLQAADLCLNEPLESVGRLPAALQEIFNQARERTAMKVFNAALQQQVDLLVLTGTLTQFDQEPRLACFLMEQFKRLHAAGVCVVWAVDERHPLPAWAQESPHLRRLEPGQSAGVDSSRTSARVLIRRQSPHHNGQDASPSRQSQGRDLVITIQDNSVSRRIEFYSPAAEESQIQEIRPVQSTRESTDDSGMVLVQVSPDGRLKSERIPTATVHWATEWIELNSTSTMNTLVAEVIRRSRQYQSADACELICMDWGLTGYGAVWNELVADLNSSQLLQRIRTHSDHPANVWSRKIMLQPGPEQYDDWGKSPALVESLRQLKQLSTADLAASACGPHFLDARRRGALMTQQEFSEHKIRLVRELRLAPAGWMSPTD